MLVMKKNDTKSFMKYIQNFDEDFKLSDFTPEELDEILTAYTTATKKFKDNYFSFYDDVKSSSLKKQDW